MLPLPTPVRGGDLNDLRDFINVADDAAWALAKAWLTGTFTPVGPKALLALKGEQGSAKSTTARCLRSLVDPATPALRRPPRDERDLAIAARSTWILGFDNVSELPHWLSDALCTLATGGGFATRELYTNFEEALFDAQRPEVLTGIEDFIARGDLQDRAIELVLPAIEEERRKDEETFWSEFHRKQPGLFGALLDRVSGALRELPTVKLSRMPRMADFARWSVAAERGSGEEPAFMAAYTDLRGNAHYQTVEGSLIGPVLLRFCEAQAGHVWEGTATDLLASVNELAGEGLPKNKYWPKTGRKLSGELRRLAHYLRGLDYTVTFLGNQGTNRKRLIQIAPTGEVDDRSERSDRSDPTTDGQEANGTRTVQGESERYETQPFAGMGPNTAHANGLNDANGMNGVYSPCSEGPARGATMNGGSHASFAIGALVNVRTANGDVVNNTPTRVVSITNDSKGRVYVHVDGLASGWPIDRVELVERATPSAESS